MGISWYIQRARRMSALEIAQKAWARAREPWLLHGVIRAPGVARLRDDVRLPFELAPTDQLDHPALLRVAKRVRSRDRWVLGLGWLNCRQWDWCTDPVTGQRWPSGPAYRINYRQQGSEIRLTWELNRFHDLTIMAQAFFLTGERGYVEEIDWVLSEWERANPVGMGPNWISAMEAAIRVVNLTWTARLIGSARPDLMERLGRQVSQHRRYIAAHLSKGSSANNHVVLELMGLVVAEAFWQEAGMPDQCQRHARQFVTALDQQTGPDGLHGEMASHYHLLVSEAAWHVGTALGARGLDSGPLAALLGRLSTVIEALTVSEGMCRFGDDDDGAIVRFPDDAVRWDQVLSGGSASAWVPLSSRPPVPDWRQAIFDGLVVIRWHDWRVVIDAAAVGWGPLYAHAHDDGGSVYIAYGGRWWVIDPGTGVYFRDLNRRRSMVEALSHNAPVPTGRRAFLTAPFGWGRLPVRFRVSTVTPASTDAIAVAVVDERDQIRRTVWVSDQTVRIIDEATTPFRVRLTMAGEPPRREGCGRHRIRQSGMELCLSAATPVHFETARWCRRFGEVPQPVCQWLIGPVLRTEWEVSRC